jgi:hypothetical protein
MELKRTLVCDESRSLEGTVNKVGHIPKRLLDRIAPLRSRSNPHYMCTALVTSFRRHYVHFVQRHHQLGPLRLLKSSPNIGFEGLKEL